MRQILMASLVALSVGVLGCGPRLIPGLEIDLADTADHRALLGVMESFRQAYESMDVEGLVALASKRFFETSGSTGTQDDYNYDGLRDHFSEHFKRIEKLTLNLQLKDVRVTGDLATIDYRFVTRYLMKLPSGDKWQITDDINRMQLSREDPQWKILSGM